MAADRGLNVKRRRRLSDDVKRAQSGGGSCWLTWRAENFACASRRAVPRARAARAAHSHLGLWLSLRVLAQLPPLLPPSPPPMHELERTVGVLAAPTDRCEPAAREIAHCCAASASLCADSAQARPVDAHSKWRPSQLPCEGERRWRAYKNAPAAGAAGCARLVRRRRHQRTDRGALEWRFCAPALAADFSGAKGAHCGASRTHAQTGSRASWRWRCR